jgi:hypothetical protein
MIASEIGRFFYININKQINHFNEGEKMDGNVLMTVTVAAGCASILFGYLGYRRGLNRDCRDEGALKNDTEYIKRRIDDVLLEQKDTNKSINALAERVTRVEESAKQAHKRIDGLDNRLSGNESSAVKLL